MGYILEYPNIYLIGLNRYAPPEPQEPHPSVYLTSTVLVRMVFTPPMRNVEERVTLLAANLLVGLEILHTIRSTRYPPDVSYVARQGFGLAKHVPDTE